MVHIPQYRVEPNAGYQSLQELMAAKGLSASVDEETFSIVSLLQILNPWPLVAWLWTVPRDCLSPTRWGDSKGKCKCQPWAVHYEVLPNGRLVLVPDLVLEPVQCCHDKDSLTGWITFATAVHINPMSSLLAIIYKGFLFHCLKAEN